VSKTLEGKNNRDITRKGMYTIDGGEMGMMGAEG
jgi:hypothetical protein